MKIGKFSVDIEGVTPLIINNPRMANPLDSYSKKLKSLTAKRKKTEDDHLDILGLHWEAAIYWDDSLGLYMPWENLYAMMLSAAKKYRLGPKMGSVSFTDPIGFKLKVPNCTSIESLRADQSNRFIRLVNIQRSKTLSCRPIFRNWSLSFEFEFESDVFDANEVKTILIAASRRCGLGVWRPNSPKPGPYGTFTIKRIVYTNSEGKKVTLGEENEKG